MKRLVFLIDSNYNSLINKIVDYLINAGHFVDIIEDEDSKKWLKNYTYNLKIVKLDKLHYSKFDYLISTAKKVNNKKIPEIIFEITQAVDHKLKISVKLNKATKSKWNKFLSIKKEAILFRKELPDVEYDINALYENIKECFIDALLAILRQEDYPLRFIKKKSNKSLFPEALNLEQQVNQLNSHYNSFNADIDSIFLIKNSIEYYTNKHNNFIKIKHKLQLNKLETELLVLYLLAILNARHEAVYKYDLIDNNKCITKYVAITLETTYSEIIKQLQDSWYDLVHNPFFVGYKKLNNDTEVILSFGPSSTIGEVDEKKYLVKLNYNIKKQELIIYFNEKIFFFEGCIELIDYFNKNIKKWIRDSKFYPTLGISSNFSNKWSRIWNRISYSDSYIPKNKVVHAFFEEQVKKNPNKIALIFENKKITYNELNEQANQLANYLKKNYQIKEDDLILLFLDRSEYIVIAMLAVLKAGGAYVPVDIECPSEKMKYILQDTEAKVIITNESQQNKLALFYHHTFLEKTSSLVILALDCIATKKILNKFPKSNPETLVNENHLAYVVYTSGTTGNPKGVMIEHKNLVNFINAHTSLIQENDIFMSYINYVFDAINTEIYLPLSNGNLLHVLNSKVRVDLDELFQYIKENAINFIVLPAVISAEFLSKYNISDTSIRTIVMGGEIYKGPININKINLINAYGPSEATVCTTLHQYQEHDINTNIGTPIANTACYILDENLNPLPVGVIGELYIGGLGLAREYLNQPQLTKEKFIRNPFQTQQEKLLNINTHIYKSGDLVRSLANHDIEYISRNDPQIKINGYRIELLGIESKLHEYPEIKQAVVLAENRSDRKYIIAYYVSDKKIKENKIITFLKQYLPEYMLPSFFVHIDKLPLTINGKLDKGALPDPKITIKDSYIPPSNLQESLICEIFGEVLNVDKVGVNDSFFQLGGDSVSAIRLTSKLQANFDIKLGDVLHLRTPKQLAKNATFGKNVLKNKLELVKLSYQNQSEIVITEYIENKIKKYLEETKNENIDVLETNPTTDVLLTGATGYLGSNILHQLLTETSYSVHILVRSSSSQEAAKRLNKSFEYYFDSRLEFYKDRIFIYPVDLEQEKFGIRKDEYNNLANRVNSIIHAAALVKHYGNYDEFHRANVQVTSNLLKFAKIGNKDFHYISTTAPLVEGQMPQYKYYVFDETDDAQLVNKHQSLYAQTKYEGEALVIKYREDGVRSSIYRLGNLAFMAKNCKLQANIQDNAFYHWVKCLLQMKCIAPEISVVDLTPVDFAAKAIVRLFDKSNLQNRIFHIFNPYAFDMANITLNNILVLNKIPMDQFIDKIAEYIDNNSYGVVERFLLRQHWLDDIIANKNSIKVLQDKTQNILKQLGFEWYPISGKMFEEYIKNILASNN